MTESTIERIDDFLMTLETALGRSSRQNNEILAEVRADLHSLVKRFQDDGCSENEAVAQALEEMGNPYELAHHVRWEVPPFGGELFTSLRFVAAFGVSIWLMFLLWYFRAGSYGVRGVSASLGVMLLHLPVILVLWPRIVWRRNWLFGLIPAGLAFGFAFFMSTGGVHSQQSINIRIPQSADEVAVSGRLSEQEWAAASDTDRSIVFPLLVFTGAGIVTLILLLAMQQQSQRRMVLLSVLLAFTLVEVPFQVEEFLFRRDRQQVRDFADASFEQNGIFPTTEDFKSRGPELRGKKSRVRTSSEQFSLSWGRPLCSGFSIQYSSEDDRLWVQD